MRRANSPEQEKMECYIQGHLRGLSDLAMHHALGKTMKKVYIGRPPWEKINEFANVSNRNDNSFQVETISGETCWNTTDSDILVFESEDGCIYLLAPHFYYGTAYIESINGDLDDLCNTKLLRAERYSTDVAQLDCEPPYDEFAKWTFYHFATHKGRVTLRWFGAIDCCYSVDVHYYAFASNDLARDYEDYEDKFWA